MPGYVLAQRGAIGHQPANQSINQSIDPNHAGERSGRRRPWISTSGSSATSGRRHGKVNNRIANARLELTEQTHISHFIQEMDRPRPRGGQEARRAAGRRVGPSFVDLLRDLTQGLKEEDVSLPGGMGEQQVGVFDLI